MDAGRDNQTQSRPALLGMDLGALRQVASEVGLRSFAAGQMASWLFKRGCVDFAQMTDLPKDARAILARDYEIGREEPLVESLSTDGTAKYLFRGAPGRDIESVVIPDADRATLCVSSQAGCRMNCAFCMTGRGGFQGQLTAAQIINQVLSVPQSASLTNIVFMGMGEPADNVAEVIRAIDILTAPWGMAWSPRRITVSTIGKTDGLKALLEQTQAHIAISVHNPIGGQRGQIMPVEKAYPLEEVMNLLRSYDFRHQRRLSLEYTLFAGRNDSPAHARALADIARSVDARVNLIRFHRIPGFEGHAPAQKSMEAFRDALNAAGVVATIRASRGEDIMAACGMLAGDKNNKQA